MAARVWHLAKIPQRAVVIGGFVLASASPRRVELLSQIGIQMGRHFHQRPANIDESRLPGECPKDYVCRMASNKARVVFERMEAEALDPAVELSPVLGADTTVVLGDNIFGKPENKAESVETLLALSGRRHQVLSAVAMYGITSGGVVDGQCLLSQSWVSFAALTRSQCEAYWHTGEPQGKAGSYAIQGRGAVFVTEIQGSYSGIVGLPLVETVALLENYGLAYWNEP